MVQYRLRRECLTVNSIRSSGDAAMLKYFRPSLSYHLSLRSLFCLFLSGHFTQVLLYLQIELRFNSLTNVIGAKKRKKKHLNYKN